MSKTNVIEWVSLLVDVAIFSLSRDFIAHLLGVKSDRRGGRVGRINHVRVEESHGEGQEARVRAAYDNHRAVVWRRFVCGTLELRLFRLYQMLGIG